MKPTTIIEKKALQESLADYLEDRLQPHKTSKAYDELVDALYDYLVASKDSREEKRAALYHAKEQMEDLAYFEMRWKGSK